MQVLYDTDYERPPPAERLHAMIHALASGGELDAAMRAEILDALKRLEARQANDALRSARGQPVAHHTFQAATLMKLLIDDHGVRPNKAACAAATGAYRAGFGLTDDALKDDQVDRTYRKIRDAADGGLAVGSGKRLVSVLLDPRLVADALARLPKSAKRKQIP